MLCKIVYINIIYNYTILIIIPLGRTFINQFNIQILKLA